MIHFVNQWCRRKDLLTINNATHGELEQWDTLVENSNNGTMFHKVSFLAYHGKRFNNEEKHIVWHKGEHPFALMSFTLKIINDKKVMISPYGSSYGGPVVSKPLKLKEAYALVDALNKYILKENVDECRLTLPPSIYYKNNCEALSYSLEKFGFSIQSKDIISVLELKRKSYEDVWNGYKSSVRRIIRKTRNDFKIIPKAPISQFYEILLEDKQRLNGIPTHTLEELKWLNNTFPESIWVDIAVHKETGARAGICYFAPNEKCLQTFYLSQETEAIRLNGVNVLVDFGINNAVEQGFSYFDFGSSTVGYDIQNMGVATFKETFGSFSSTRSTYVLKR